MSMRKLTRAMAIILTLILSVSLFLLTTVSASATTAENEGLVVNSTGTYNLFNSGSEIRYPYAEYYNPAPSSFTNNGNYLYYSTFSCSSEGPIGLPFTINGTVTERSTVTVNAYDVDESYGETDDVYLRDLTTGTSLKLGKLSGEDSTWNTTSLEIDASAFVAGHTYQLYLECMVDGWEVWLDTASIAIGRVDDPVGDPTGPSIDSIEGADIVADINNSGEVSVTLEIDPTEENDFAVEFKATHIETNNQIGSLFVTTNVQVEGTIAIYTFTIDNGAPMGVYRIDVYIKNAITEDLLKTVSCYAGYQCSAVSYNPNGGSNNLPTDTNAYFEGDVVTIRFDYVPSLTGYTFLGWATSKDATVPEFTLGDVYTYVIGANNVTLYAVWAEGEEPVRNGIYPNELGILCFYVDGEIVGNKGLIQIGINIHFVCYSGKIQVDGYQTITEENSNGLLEPGVYYFDAEGNAVLPPVPEVMTGINYIDGIAYYFENGKLAKNKGAIQIGEDIYYVCASGKIKVSGGMTITETSGNGILEAGKTYFFDAEGKLIVIVKIEIPDGIHYINGVPYYYENGVIAKNKGLIEIDGKIYYVCYSGKIKIGNMTVAPGMDNGLLEPGKTYEFGEDGAWTEKAW